MRMAIQWDGGYCLLVGAGLSGCADESCWLLQTGSGKRQRVAGTILASGPLPSGFDLQGWESIGLSVKNQVLPSPFWFSMFSPSSIDLLTLIQLLMATINSKLIANVSTTGAVPVFNAGQVSLRSGYHFARFDDLLIQGTIPPPPSPMPANSLFTSFEKSNCDRTDFTGLSGVQITVGSHPLVLTRYSPPPPSHHFRFSNLYKPGSLRSSSRCTQCIARQPGRQGTLMTLSTTLKLPL